MSTAMYTSNTPDVVVDEKIYDLVGLGFGPANVALAGALIEKWESGEVNIVISYYLHSTPSSILRLLLPRLPSTFQEIGGLMHLCAGFV